MRLILDSKTSIFLNGNITISCEGKYIYISLLNYEYTIHTHDALPLYNTICSSIDRNEMFCDITKTILWHKRTIIK